MAGRIYIQDEECIHELIEKRKHKIEQYRDRQRTLNVWLKTTAGGEKRDMLETFGKGAEKHDIKVNYCMEDHTEVPPADYEIIFAFKSDGINSPTHRLRQKVFDMKTNKQIFFFDSNVLKYYEKMTRYFRLPYRHIYPQHAEYMMCDPLTFDRKPKVMKEMGLELKPMRKDGNHILLCLNRGFGGFSSFGKGCYEWARETVEELRKHTQRPIVIRSHNHAKETPELQEDKKNLDLILKNHKDITHTALGKTDLLDDMKNAWAVVCYTSTSGAVALMEGIPMFATHEGCFAGPWGSGKLEDIENPKEVNRLEFLHEYINSHWTLQEIEDGTFWGKFKKHNIRR